MKNDLIKNEIKNSNKILADKLKLHNKFQMQYLQNYHFKKILNLVNVSGNILEIGSGLGEFFKNIKNIKFKKLILTEISEKYRIYLKKIVKKNKRVLVKKTDAENLHKFISRNSIDLIVAKGVVHHLYSVNKSFDNFSKTLKKGGQLLIFEGNKISFYRNVSLKIAKLLNINHEISKFQHLTYTEIIKVAKSKNLKLKKIYFLPGLIAPFCYMNIGNYFFLNFVQRVNAILSIVSKKHFSWWVILIFEK